MDQQGERMVGGKEQMAAVEAVHESSVPQGSEDLNRRRREKIQERLSAVLDSTDTLQACMAPVTCDLLEMLQDLKRGIDEAFGVGPLALERSAELAQPSNCTPGLPVRRTSLPGWSTRLRNRRNKGSIDVASADVRRQQAEKR